MNKETDDKKEREGKGREQRARVLANTTNSGPV